MSLLVGGWDLSDYFGVLGIWVGSGLGLDVIYMLNNMY